MAPSDPKRQAPRPSTRDDAGIHKDREAIGEDRAKTRTRGEPLSEADRDAKRGEDPVPASEPQAE
jgi:hypothetical protein